MVNTNGVRIAQEEDFAKRLAEVRDDFEVYLQFDSFEREPLMQLRGADLRRVRLDALENLNRYNISTNLVVTLKKGLNDHEIGQHHRLRAATALRPRRNLPAHPGRWTARKLQPASDRLTLTEVRRKILEQTNVFRPEDVIPVPCHPDSLAMAYALKLNGTVVPLTSMIPPEVLINGAANTILYEQDPRSAIISSNFLPRITPRAAVPARFVSFSVACQKCSCPDNITYENVFRVIIMQFIDAHSFDVRSVKKTCVHIVHPDGRLIPFDTYNLFYRDGLEVTRLGPLRRNAELALAALDYDSGSAAVDG